jgi:voltage-gated potassium channel
MEGRTTMKKKRSAPARGAGHPGEGGGVLGRYFGTLYADLSKNGLMKIALAFAIVLAADGIAVWLLERAAGNEAFSGVFDGLWWSFVTNATVGYGDKVPGSPLGRVTAMLFMLASLVTTALVSGTLASIFVERRIREGKGLMDVNAKGHTLLLGWNANADNIIASMAPSSGGRMKTAVVLVNASEGDWFDGVKSRFPAMDLRFVRGDFTSEAVLKRADAAKAKAVIIIPDASGGSAANADERSILAALAVKALNPEARLSVEIFKPESEAHMRRAGADGIVLNGEFSGYLLASSLSSSGVSEAARRLFTPGQGGPVRNRPFPRDLVGKPFIEASERFMREGRGLLIGVLSEEKGVSLTDIVSNDSSAIDDFIRRKFQESDISLEDEENASRDVKLNPGPGYLIRETDAAFVIGEEA